MKKIFLFVSIACATVLANPLVALAAPGVHPLVVRVSVPEGGKSLLYMLLAGAPCFGAMFFSSRNQFGKRETD